MDLKNGWDLVCNKDLARGWAWVNGGDLANGRNQPDPSHQTVETCAGIKTLQVTMAN